MSVPIIGDAAKIAYLERFVLSLQIECLIMSAPARTECECGNVLVEKTLGDVFDVHAFRDVARKRAQQKSVPELVLLLSKLTVALQKTDGRKVEIIQ